MFVKDMSGHQGFLQINTGSTEASAAVPQSKALLEMLTNLRDEKGPRQQLIH